MLEQAYMLNMPDEQRKTLSLVVPVFNEEEGVAVFVARVEPELARVRDYLGPGTKTEFVFVDDGSTDRTFETLRSLATIESQIRVIKLSRNFGKDAALTAGFIHAKGEAVVAIDVDLQDPPELLLDMVKAWKEGARVVNAVRVDRSSDSWSKRQSASAFYRLFNSLSSYTVPQNVGDFRLLDRQVVNQLNTLEERVRFNKGLVAWCGYEAVAVPYSRPQRELGTTKWKLWTLWNFALDGITGTSTLPLRIWSYVGAFIALFALGYAALIVIRTLILGIDVPGYASTMAVTLTLGAANLIALGILGEYVGRISIEVRRRPLFLIETIESVAGTSDSVQTDKRKPAS